MSPGGPSSQEGDAQPPSGAWAASRVHPSGPDKLQSDDIRLRCSSERSKAWKHPQETQVDSNEKSSQKVKESLASKSAVTIQRAVRRRLLHKTRLDRGLLVERLNFERQLVGGLLQLVVLITIFVCLMYTVGIVDRVKDKFAIHSNLKASFDFDSLSSVKTPEGLNDMVGRVAVESKKYFPTSSVYFQEDEGGAVELLTGQELFKQARELPIAGSTLWVDAPTFSFTSWVQLDSRFLEGYIIRKQIKVWDEDSLVDQVTCWGWHVSSNQGPTWTFGGHDYYAPCHNPSQCEVRQDHEYSISLPNPIAVPSGTVVLMGVVVRADNVTFFMNQEELGTVPMPRKVTDCFTSSGLLLGSNLMRLMNTRFYPFALSQEMIREVFLSGTLLRDLSTGTWPRKEKQIMKYNGMDEFSQVESQVEDVGYSLDQQIRDTAALRLSQTLLLSQMQGLVGDAAEAEDGEALPSLPNNEVPVNGTAVYDASTGARYHSLVPGTVAMTESDESNARYLDVANTPSFYGTGVTFTFWYRHRSPGGYVLVGQRGTANADMCWSVYIEDAAIYSNWGVTTTYPTFTDEGDEKILWTSGAWRHIAWQFDVDGNYLRFFLDGALAYQEQAEGFDFRQLDCDPNSAGPERVVALGHRFPGWTYGITSDLADVRMYSGDVALSPKQIRTLAFQSSADGLVSPECLPLDQLRDEQWEDANGHSCMWFHQQEDKSVSCNLADARMNCPLACNSKQLCYEEPAQGDLTFQLWDRVQLLSPTTHPSGTICMADVAPADLPDLRAKCEAWVEGLSAPNSSTDQGWLTWQRLFQAAQGKRLNVSDCESLMQAIDPYCSFDMDTIREFTSAMVAGGGDYTIRFWVKPVDQDSYDPDLQFVPQLTFYSQLSPPQHHLLMTNNQGQVRGCVQHVSARDEPDDPSMMLDRCVEHDRFPVQEEWTFVAITFKNATQEEPSSAKVFVNTKWHRESAGGFAQHLYDPSALFTAIESNYPILITPLELSPRVYSDAELQLVYYQTKGRMPGLKGPQINDRQRQTMQSKVTKSNYPYRSALLAPPIIFQQRAHEQVKCAYSYSSEWIVSQHESMLSQRCARSDCDDDLLDNEFSVMSCKGGSVGRGNTYFGLNASRFHGNIGFADLLYTITDHEYIVRDGELLRNTSFIDSGTTKVDVILTMFSPALGIITVLNIAADMNGGQQVLVEVQISHIELFGEGKAVYYGMLMFVILLAIVLCIQILLKFKTLIASWKVFGRLPQWSTVAFPMLYLAMYLGIILFLATSLQIRLEQEDNALDTLSSLDSIRWWDSQEDMSVKYDSFFSNVEQVLDLVEISNLRANLFNVLLCLLVLRICVATSTHPRLALLTETIRHSLDDLWHASILIVLLMSSFAAIGSWRFGADNEQFSTFEKAIQTQLMMMLGQYFPLDWDTKLDMAVFTIAYFVVIFFLIVNFVLGIIIDAHAVVRQKNNELETEQEFMHDAYSCMCTLFYAWWYKWPPLWELSGILSLQQAKISIGYAELLQTGLFGEGATAFTSVPAFLKYFATYDFLAVRPREKSESERMMAELDNRLANKIKNMPVTLVDLAQGKGSTAVDDKLSSLEDQHSEQALSVQQGVLRMMNSIKMPTHDQSRRQGPEARQTKAPSETERTEQEAVESKLKLLAAQLETFISTLTTRFPHDKDFIETLATTSMGLVRKTNDREAHFACAVLHYSSSPSLARSKVSTEDRLPKYSSPDHEHLDVQVLT